MGLNFSPAWSASVRKSAGFDSWSSKKIKGDVFLIGWSQKRRTKRGKGNQDLRSWQRVRLITWMMVTDGESTARKLWKTALFQGIFTHTHINWSYINKSINPLFNCACLWKRGESFLLVVGATTVAPAQHVEWRREWKDPRTIRPLLSQPTKAHTHIPAPSRRVAASGWSCRREPCSTAEAEAEGRAVTAEDPISAWSHNWCIIISSSSSNI